ncbi:MAG: MFS transporter [Candidatus Bathyarchaeota archaeon]
MISLPKYRYRFVILAVSMFATFAGFIPTTSYSVAIPAFITEFGVTLETASLGYTLLAFGTTVGAGIGGPLTARLGLKKVYATAVFLVVVPQFFMPISSFEMILVLRFIQGLGILLYLPALIVISNAWFSAKEVGIVTGAWIGAQSFGSAIGGLLSGILFPDLGWRITFYYLGILSLVLIVIWLFLAKMPPKLMADGGSHNKNKPRKVKEERFDVFKMKATWLNSLAIIGFTWPIYALMFHLPAYGYFLGFSPMQVGELTFYMAVAGFIAAPIGGTVTGILTAKTGALKIGCGISSIIGTSIAIIGVILLPIIGPLSYGYFAIAALMAGMIWWTDTCVYTLPHAIYSKEKLVLGSGVVNFFGNITNGVAPLIMLVVVASLGWMMGWYLSAAVMSFGILFFIPFFRFPRLHQKNFSH